MNAKEFTLLAQNLLRQYYLCGKIDPIVELLTEDCIGYGNRSTEFAVGRKEVEDLLKSEYRLVTPCKITRFGCTVKETPRGMTAQINAVLLIENTKAVLHRQSVMFSEHPDGSPAITGMHIMRDARYDSRMTLLKAQRCDRLTGLYKQEAFCQRAQEIMRSNPSVDFEILCFDIMRFKVINELYGVEKGDELLQGVAKHLKQLNLPLSVVARLHSDHFILCYPLETGRRMKIIDSIRSLSRTFVEGYEVSFAFGAYTVTDRDLSVNAMCDRATMGKAQIAKNAMLACGEYHEELRENILMEQIISNNMHRAIEREEFVVYLQPKFDLNTSKIIGAEALVRWTHPELGFIAPDRFIPVFERNGFVYQMDQFICEKVCQMLRSELDQGLPAFPISVNISRVDIYSPDFVDVILGIVEKYNIPHHLLGIEVTETAYSENLTQVINVLKRLQEEGFTILMDDFGSGYSSLNMLKEMPVDVLKIDLRFLTTTGSEEEMIKGGNIINSIVRMAKWLQLPVIIEGVETQEQVEFLRAIGCESAQGYYFARPLPIPAYTDLVQSNTEHVETPKEQSSQKMQGFCVYELRDGLIYTHYISRWLEKLNKKKLPRYQEDAGGAYLKSALPPDVYAALHAKLLAVCHTGKSATMEYPFPDENHRDLFLFASLHKIGEDRGGQFCFSSIVAVRRENGELLRC